MWQPLKSGGGVEVSDAGDDAADGDVATGVQGADLSKVPRSVRRAAFVGVSLLAPHRRVDGGRGESYHNRRCNNAQCTRASHREPNATRAIADNARRLLAGDRLRGGASTRAARHHAPCWPCSATRARRMSLATWRGRRSSRRPHRRDPVRPRAVCHGIEPGVDTPSA
jgi:hypothetical protein